MKLAFHPNDGVDHFGVSQQLYSIDGRVRYVPNGNQVQIHLGRVAHEAIDSIHDVLHQHGHLVSMTD